MFETIITTEELSHISTSPDTLIVDCRAALGDPLEGQYLYESDHLPGAVFCDMNRQMASYITPSTGRHPLPLLEDFQQMLGEWGVTENTQVVCYDGDSGSMAAGRLWWLLKICGHQAAAVLDGGYPAWLREKRPTDDALPQPRQAVKNTYQYDQAKYLSTGQIEAIHRNPNWVLLDARGPLRYSGLEEMIDVTGGHIPGAVNVPYTNLLDGLGKFKPDQELRSIFEKAMAGHTPEQTGLYCGSGVTSVLLLLAMEKIGLKGARIYPGSWSEWIRDGKHEIAAGAH